jgi:uncharacterized protein YdaU (DUF1376 family)
MSKSNSPAFQFYPSDFISGTIHMSPEEVGAYIRLLCYQWEHEAIPDEIKILIRITGAKKATIVEVLKKFTKSEKGLINHRLKKSLEEQIEYRKRKSEAGKKGNQKRWEIDNKEVAKESQSDNSASVLQVAEPIAKNRPSSFILHTSYNDLCVRARDMTCNFFSVTEQKNFRAFKEITEAVTLIDQKEQLGYYIQQLEAYNKFKSLTGQQKCNYITWLFGESIEERHIDNGHWCRIDYENQIKELTANGKSNQKNNSGARRAATAAIESGSIKDFGSVKL